MGELTRRRREDAKWAAKSGSVKVIKPDGTVEMRQAKPSVELASRAVPAGKVEMEAHSGEWLLVAVGRATRTKRFNLTRSELARMFEVAKRDGYLP